MKIRFGVKKLIWEEFFDLNGSGRKHAKYSIHELKSMNREELHNVISEYFFYVYFQYYKDNGFVNFNVYDPDILEQLGLPYNADLAMIKKRFHELVKEHHPDMGGDSNRFIEIIEKFNRLEI